MRKSLLAIISSIAFLNAFSQPGSLDLSFGVNGLATVPLDVHLNKIVVQTDGKIVGAGYITSGTGSIASCIVRYKTDGTLDNSFNGTGILTDAFMKEALGLAVQPDGKIVTVGYVTTNSSYTDPDNPDNNVIDVGSDFAIARYNTDGAADLTFDDDGKVSTNISQGEDNGAKYFSGDKAYSVVIKTDGTIMVAGTVWGIRGIEESYIAVVGYSNNGLIIYRSSEPSSSGEPQTNPALSIHDNTIILTYNKGFRSIITNLNFRTEVLLEDYDTYVHESVIQSDGKILVVGNAYGGYDFVGRYNVDGTLDNSFSGDGIVQVLPEDGTHEISSAELTSIAIQPDGKIIVGGTQDDKFILIRYNADGTLDVSFGDGGTQTSDVTSGKDEVTDLAVANGSVYALGSQVIAAYRLGVKEICGNSKDDDLDGLTDEDCLTENTWYRDADGDGYGDPSKWVVSMVQPRGYVSNNLDCNDKNNTKGGPEVCDGIDNDCDGIIDNGLALKMFYSDFDGDSYGSLKRTVMACAAPPRYVAVSGDCNDNDNTIYPGAPELCDGKDNNCNGQVDEELTQRAFYYDRDGDGYGFQRAFYACSAPRGYVTRDGDCNDGDASVHPGAEEIPGNGIDDNCNGQIDEQSTNAMTLVQRTAGNRAEEVQALLLTAMPNPSASYFTLVINGSTEGKAQLRVLDAVGRVIETKDNIPAKATLTIGHHYQPGLYFVELIQNNQKTTLKLIKAKR